ncbi:unnamed protein product, partial [Pylaiella littoralis]
MFRPNGMLSWCQQQVRLSIFPASSRCNIPGRHNGKRGRSETVSRKERTGGTKFRDRDHNRPSLSLIDPCSTETILRRHTEGRDVPADVGSIGGYASDSSKESEETD